MNFFILDFRSILRPAFLSQVFDFIGFNVLFDGPIPCLRSRGIMEHNHEGLESAKPDLQSEFKKPGRTAGEA
jgi:hypothetical protein